MHKPVSGSGFAADSATLFRRIAGTLNQTGLTKACPLLIEELAERLGAERGYLLSMRDLLRIIHDIGQWSRQGLKAYALGKLGSAGALRSEIIELCAADESIVLNDRAALAALPRLTAALLQADEIEACVLLPLRHKEQCIGLLVFDRLTPAPSWDAAQLDLVCSTLPLFALALAHQQALILSDLFNTFTDKTFDFVGIPAPDGQLRYLNSIGYQTTGIDPQVDISTVSVADLHPPEARHKAMSVFETLMQGDNLWAGELPFLNLKTNQSIDMDLIALPFRHEETGELIAIMGIGRDITERKRAQRALAQAKDAAEKANRAKSEFLARMSHELRTPLNGILGHAQILMKARELSPERRSSISVIHQSGEHLLMLINDILDLSKIEAGHLDLQSNEFYFPEFLNVISEMIRIRAESKGLAFVYETRGKLPAVVCADENRLRQILVNLLGNAVKFTDSGKVHFRVGLQDNEMCFEVEDTGIGIEQGQHQAIFEPFQQVSDPDRLSEGTGLGLAISKQLSDAMGGEIRIESEPGRGSVFRLLLQLPIVADQQPAAAGEQQIITGYQGEVRKLLIVDDIEANRTVLLNMLRPLGFELAEAKDGDEALQKALSWQPHAVLMDLVMPGTDGLQATRWLRGNGQTKTLKIIAISASAFEYNRADALRVGCDDFISKPIKLPLLLDVLQTQLNLQWISETDEPASGLTVLPPAHLAVSLLESVRVGDVQALLDQLADLEREQPGLQPFVTELRRLANTFQVRKMRELLQQVSGAE